MGCYRRAAIEIVKINRYALYDHEKDPGENYNLAETPEYRLVVNRMKALIDAMPEPH